jgi:hypothetical protein
MAPPRTSALALAAVFCALPAACQRSAPSEAGAPSASTPASASAAPIASSAPGRPKYERVPEMIDPGAADRFPLDHVEAETKRFARGSAAIDKAADFLFVLGQGGGFDGYNTLKIDARGRAELVFGSNRSNVGWRRAVFTLTDEELAGLKGELKAIDVYGLARGYFAAVNDGTLWFVRVQAAGQKKTVILDNHFPDPIVRLGGFVRAKIVAPHAAEVTAAEPLPRGIPLERLQWEEDVPREKR